MKKIIKKLIPKFLIGWYHWLLPYLGAAIYGLPSKKMVIIGVVGTRGKTTTAKFIWSCLRAANHQTGLTSTATIHLGEKEILNPYHMTMPGRFAMQKMLRAMVRAGCKYAVIETPSEGIEQWRHHAIRYDVAVLVTLYPEYLEIHGWDYERLKMMNRKIFSALGKNQRKTIDGKKIPKTIVINMDTEESEKLLESEADQKITYGINSKANFVAEKIQVTPRNVTFSVSNRNYELALLGAHNVTNALAAIATTSALGLDYKSIKEGIGKVTSVPGRMELVKTSKKYSVFVDYAHDEVSLRAILELANKIKKNRIIILIGAEGGGRDKKKRPRMGQVAAELADLIVVSNVDPYDDDPQEIIESITQAAEKNGKVRNKNLFPIEDRREGIQKALSLALEDDIVIITGKGAEQSMIITNKTIPWDDREVVRQELEKTTFGLI
ncbi:MAG: Uncharacterized protein G01um101420_354 [Parcubacteria group bacterium Gr01-1014_20]|nr:MAG: Uncharacterized protein G01um101420_354 [Parcubacteria group bacterium Gr01-1014_20]